jgi:hypothetical protein
MDSTPKYIHVYPENDLQPHTLSSCDCHCGPRLEKLSEQETMVVHSAYDGRELIEKYGLQ